MQAMFKLLTVLLILLCGSVAFGQEEEAAEGDEAAPTTAYFALKPAFVVNYGGVGRLRYLKTAITLRVKTGGGANGMAQVRHHLPYIRHTLVMLLSQQTDEQMSSMEGRELLRQSALAAVRELLIEEEGEEFIVDLLFDSFIVQR
ncbi:flagellar basal body-associated protein FliL [Dasania sp. GY-MA-18]|uniref:Flagellar protein FliL n=1 Tax=Dasania phycosphaerae TaxID=2950436 RepID=A0A9J6RKD4_9GAMM|nr:MULTISPECIES: flagellar basal body-associated FliL family protein [Dasania]MCR8922227.1 flagellar basal body-associated protein FliL [Dasania sp. GY-MA-18]MCZ0864655.1 flagellar basal body-associated FliL family protein [Dasania phycosphaerae]MCZ0868383.1 flagellar basal body-associated FliL family protein [Dasania phycosphaerae]